MCIRDSSSCEDCAGVPNGNNLEDMCGICDSDTSNDCIQDCEGIWGGTAEYDECGICGGDNSSCTDCAGVPNGDNLGDMCGICDSDTSNDCILDCHGDWGGTAIINECLVCSGGKTGIDINAGLDCSGTCWGTSKLDECGVCGGDNSSCACVECHWEIEVVENYGDECCLVDGDDLIIDCCAEASVETSKKNIDVVFNTNLSEKKYWKNTIPTPKISTKRIGIPVISNNPNNAIYVSASKNPVRIIRAVRPRSRPILSV